MADGPTMPAEATPDADGHVTCDVAVIGAGLAGLYASILLPDHLDVVVIDKGPAGTSGSSPWAQGGMAVALGPDDSPALHVADTVAAGAGLADPAAAWVLATEAPARTAHLLELGARFDRLPGRDDSNDPRDLHLAREGGQTVARSVHTADASGAEMIRTLRSAAAPRVRRLPAAAVSLAREPGGPVAGVWVVDRDRDLRLVRARAVLVATGGCGGLFAATTNQDGATGDGVTLAYLAGAAVRDLEFVQFHPTGMAGTVEERSAWRFLLTEALRGAGATLHADDGTRFMPALHPDAELAPRHVVARSILQQPNGRAWLDATSIGPAQLAEEFPTVVDGARRAGFDLATQRVPVTPAAHYMVGGVRTDLWARTSLPGLYAAGEVASTGVHGANRMAGNSLSEALVFGRRAALAIASDDPPPGDPGPPPTLHDGVEGVDLAHTRWALREAMWAGAGPTRTADSLTRLADELDAISGRLDMQRDDPSTVRPSRSLEVGELRRAVLAADLVRTSAWHRRESRGGHIRDDHPDPDDAWADVHVERVRPGS